MGKINQKQLCGKEKYLPPQLTVVIVKPERGFVASPEPALLGLFSGSGSNELEGRQSADSDWGDGGWY